MPESDQVKFAAAALRVLVPIDATDRSRWGVQHALRLQREGAEVEVILLHVGEPVTQWQVLRFRTEREIARFQSERARFMIDEAGVPLALAGIRFSGVFRQGNLPDSILDTAEQMACDRIVMPLPERGPARHFSRDSVAAVRRRQHHIPVVAVNGEGVAPDDQQ